MKNYLDSSSPIKIQRDITVETSSTLEHLKLGNMINKILSKRNAILESVKQANDGKGSGIQEFIFKTLD
jgi:hypothetical protein